MLGTTTTRAWAVACAAGALLAAGCGDDGSAGSMEPEPMACDYPEHSGALRFGETFPPFGWRNAVDETGTSQEFLVEDFFCDEAYDAYDSMLVVVTAGWCGACPAYVQRVNDLAPQLEQNGTLLVFVEAETAAFEGATSADAVQWIDGVIAPAQFESGLRIGDFESVDENLIRYRVSAFPSAYFVRRRDMRIVADQGSTQFQLDLVSLSADPEQNWSPSMREFEPNCTAADEEPGEPNDSIEDATPLEAGVELSGGICAPGSDFFAVDAEGVWRLEMFQSLTMLENPDAQNVDLRLYDADRNRVGGSNVRGNQDFVEWEGPGYVEAHGVQNSSGTYRMMLTTF